MPSVTPAEQPSENLAIAVVGNDALIEALPARPLQFAHACRAAGFDLVLPESWGDELVAEATLRALEGRSGQPAVFCACPIVRQRLLASGVELASLLVNTVAPPVAVARHVRALYGARIGQLMYIGDCPAAGPPDYDVRYRTAEFLALLAANGIDVLSQPTVFDAVIPPDRRRFASLPGGCPAPETLWEHGHQRALVELSYGGEFAIELAQQLLARRSVLLDVAPALGCVCSGVTATTPGANARVAVMSLEPPRAPDAVVESAIVESLAEPVHGLPRTAFLKDRRPSAGVIPPDPAEAAPHARSRPPIAITPPRALNAVPRSAVGWTTAELSGQGAVEAISWPRAPMETEDAGSDTKTVRTIALPSPMAGRATIPRPARLTRPVSGSVPTVTLADPLSFRLPRAYLTRRPARRPPPPAHGGLSPTTPPTEQRPVSPQAAVVMESAQPVAGASSGTTDVVPAPPSGTTALSGASTVEHEVRQPAHRPAQRAPKFSRAPQPDSGRSRVPSIIVRTLVALLAVALLIAALRWLLSA